MICTAYQNKFLASAIHNRLSTRTCGATDGASLEIQKLSRYRDPNLLGSSLCRQLDITGQNVVVIWRQAAPYQLTPVANAINVLQA